MKLPSDVEFQAWLDTIRCRRHGTHWVRGCAYCTVCIDRLKTREGENA